MSVSLTIVPPARHRNLQSGELAGRDANLDGPLRRSYGGHAEKEESMTILPGAGAYWFEGNDIGCLLVHGFTGTPQNVRPHHYA